MTYVLLTRAPVVLLPLDLHVLGMPPAFVLSQDQTLRCECLIALKRSFRFFCWVLKVDEGRLVASVMSLMVTSALAETSSSVTSLLFTRRYLLSSLRRKTTSTAKAASAVFHCASRCQRTPRFHREGPPLLATPALSRRSPRQGRQTYGPFLIPPNHGAKKVPDHENFYALFSCASALSAIKNIRKKRISGIRRSNSDTVSAVIRSPGSLEPGIISRAIVPVSDQPMMKTNAQSPMASIPPLKPSTCHFLVKAYSTATTWSW